MGHVKITQSRPPQDRDDHMAKGNTREEEITFSNATDDTTTDQDVLHRDFWLLRGLWKTLVFEGRIEGRCWMSRSREKELLGGATKSGGQLRAYLIRRRALAGDVKIGGCDAPSIRASTNIVNNEVGDWLQKSRRVL
jgi:hypothetical protein